MAWLRYLPPGKTARHIVVWLADMRPGERRTLHAQAMPVVLPEMDTAVAFTLIDHAGEPWRAQSHLTTGRDALAAWLASRKGPT